MSTWRNTAVDKCVQLVLAVYLQPGWVLPREVEIVFDQACLPGNNMILERRRIGW